jgi:hypothetical protein
MALSSAWTSTPYLPTRWRFGKSTCAIDVRSSLKADQPEAQSLSLFADLLGVEAPDLFDPKLVGDPPDHRGLADAGHPGDQEDM